MVIPKVTKGRDFGRVLGYLAGPGRHNEHTRPHAVAADAGAEWALRTGVLDRDAVHQLVEHLDLGRRAHGSRVAKPSWACSLSLAPEDGAIPDERWRDMSEDLVRRMGLEGHPWVAVHHGASRNGQDHVHIVASRVRDDGRVWNDRHDFRRAQTACRGIERDHGLRVLPSHEAGLEGLPGLSRTELDRPVPARHDLAVRVRAAALEAGCEERFAAKLREHGVLVAPRYAKGSTDQVVGYRVRLPDDGVWYGGGKLAKDLSLPRLREQWARPTAAHEVAGAFASMSRAHERTGGPMARISREVSRSAQARRSAHAMASGVRLAALLLEPEKGPAEWLAIGATAINATRGIHASHVAAGHDAFAGELARVSTAWKQHVRPALEAAAAVEPDQGRWLEQARSTDRGVEID